MEDKQQESIFDVSDVESTNEIVSVAKKVKRKRNRPDLANFGAEKANPGDNTHYLRNALVAFSLPPIDISDPKQVENRIKEYFEWCAVNDQKPKVMGVANWLGVSRDTINSWKRGECRKDTHTEIIQKLYGVLEELWEGYMQDNKMNVVAAIFLGKVFFGYKEPTEIILTPGNPLGDVVNAEEIAEKYQSLPED